MGDRRPYPPEGILQEGFLGVPDGQLRRRPGNDLRGRRLRGQEFPVSFLAGRPRENGRPLQRPEGQPGHQPVHHDHLRDLRQFLLPESGYLLRSLQAGGRFHSRAGGKGRGQIRRGPGRVIHVRNRLRDLGESAQQSPEAHDPGGREAGPQDRPPGGQEHPGQGFGPASFLPGCQEHFTKVRGSVCELAPVYQYGGSADCGRQEPHPEPCGRGRYPGSRGHHEGGRPCRRRDHQRLAEGGECHRFRVRGIQSVR